MKTSEDYPYNLCIMLTLLKIGLYKYMYVVSLCDKPIYCCIETAAKIRVLYVGTYTYAF